MKTFILLSFGLLGWAFYEMSGGEEFEPASERLARLNPAPESESPEVATTSAEPPITVAETDSGFVDTDPPLDNEVTRISLDLTTLGDVITEDQESIAADAEPQPEYTQEVPRNAALVTQSGDTPAIIPSLITGTAPVAGTSEPNSLVTSNSTGFQDIRTVSGNRVNVRGGPSTDFSVVDRLELGDAVEVLEEDGNGWVRMRSVETGEEGWMADFLLTAG
ncbi:MAG: SH3 domain-containing protein [Sulfitobacter sp.]|nr:SH3 domain-containing protein [Sulfitobacter sp.]